MSLKYKLSSAALLAVVATTAMASSADAFQTRKHFCEDSFFWTCGSASTDPQMTNPTARRAERRPASPPPT